MAKKLQYEVNMDTGDSVKTLGTLRDELEQINEELEGVEVGSKAFTDLANKARGVSSEIKTLEKEFEGLEPGQKAEAFVGAFETIAGASAITAGAFSLFGVESEKLGQIEEKVQATIAIAVGARSIAEGALQAKIAARLAVEKAVQVAAKAQIVVQTALNAVLNANPIGAILLAVTGAVVIFTKFGDKIKSLIKDNLQPLNDVLEKVGGWLRRVGSAIGLVASEEELAAEKAKELSQSKIEQYERELTIAKARGEDTIEIERNILNEKMKLYEKDSKEYKDLQTELVALNAQRAREEEEQRKKEEQAREDERKKRLEDYRKRLEDAKKLEQEIADEAALIGLTEEEKAIELENRKFQERLAIFEKFNLDTTELERLHQEELNKIQSDAQAKRDADAEAKRKEKEAKDKEAEDAELARQEELASLQNEIRDASAVKEDELRALELTKLEEYYNQLILSAQEAGLNTQNLEDAKNAALSMKKDSFRQEDLDKEKAYQQQISDLTIGAASNVISTLGSLNELFAGKTEEEQKKAFKRNQALQIAETIIRTYSSATAAYNSQLAIPTPDAPIRAAIAAAAAVAAGLVNVAKIKAQKFEGAGATGGDGGGGTGGGGRPGGGIQSFGSITAPEGTVQTPLITPQSQQPAIKTYVLSGDVTDGQEADKLIEQRRTL
jgi:hypothetical protein